MDELKNELKNSILKTGTSIVGIVCKDGIVMAADRQSTAGMMVMDKESEKVTPVNEYVLIAGTGMVSAIQRLKKILAAELRLKELRSRCRPTIKQAANLTAAITYSDIRQMSMVPNIVGTLIAGVNEDGSFELYTIEPAGSIIKVKNYDANFGSGMPYILGLLERQYKNEITVKEGIELAKEALKSSTQRDIGSGYGIDVYMITKEGIKKVVSQKIKAEYMEQ